jgi:hypothetical protein
MWFDLAPIKICRQLLIATILLTACQTVYAALPVFQDHNIAPLFGSWRSAMGKGHAVTTIGPTWWTTVGITCPQRNRYEVLSIGTKTQEGEQSVHIVVRMFGARFLRHEPHRRCPERMLDREAFADIFLIDQGDAPDAPIIVFGWETCDTLEHLQQPVDPGNPDVKSCGAGGGIMDRVTKHIRHP